VRGRKSAAGAFHSTWEFWRAKIYWPGPKEDYPSDRILVTIKPLKDFHFPAIQKKNKNGKSKVEPKAKQKPWRRQMK